MVDYSWFSIGDLAYAIDNVVDPLLHSSSHDFCNLGENLFLLVGLCNYTLYSSLKLPSVVPFFPSVAGNFKIRSN